MLPAAKVGTGTAVALPVPIFAICFFMIHLPSSVIELHENSPLWVLLPLPIACGFCIAVGVWP
jgi:hypothetical protein